VGKNILCIDDDVGIIELVQLIMQREGVMVRGASSGIEGLAAMKADAPGAVLLDIMMPEMDGWETYKYIKSDPMLAQIPVVILTARNSSFEEVIARERAGVDDYITKPFTPQELRDRINKVLAAKEPDAEQ